MFKSTTAKTRLCLRRKMAQSRKGSVPKSIGTSGIFLGSILIRNGHRCNRRPQINLEFSSVLNKRNCVLFSSWGSVNWTRLPLRFDSHSRFPRILSWHRKEHGAFGLVQHFKGIAVSMVRNAPGYWNYMLWIYICPEQSRSQCHPPKDPVPVPVLLSLLRKKLLVSVHLLKAPPKRFPNFSCHFHS